MRIKNLLSQWFRSIDILGLAGCAILVLVTYSIFWYYTETVKGAFEDSTEEIENLR